MPLTGLTAQDITAIAALCKSAGELALTMREGVAFSEKGPGDFVTAADQAVSKILVNWLGQRFPGDLIVSEEGDRHQAASDRVWLVDPIDGTTQYLQKSDQFCVMIGLVVDGKPAFGWIYRPTKDTGYFGGPGQGTYKQRGQEPAQKVDMATSLPLEGEQRLIITRRDARSRPWLSEMAQVKMCFVGSIGVRITWLIDNRADMTAHLQGWMKVWDTAAPSAVALGAGLEVGSGHDFAPLLPYPEVYQKETFQQQFAVVVGKPGTLEWARRYLSPRDP